MEGQELRVFYEKSNQVVLIPAFAREVLHGWAELITRENCRETLVVAEVGERGYRPWTRSLWTYSVETKASQRITAGHDLKLSPDHAKAVFMKREKSGFHCICLWEIATGKIEPVLSLWEGDPGSGVGWEYNWSDDAKALKIAGRCGGFYRIQERGPKQFEYVFLVEDRKMYSVQQ